MTFFESIFMVYLFFVVVGFFLSSSFSFLYFNLVYRYLIVITAVFKQDSILDFFNFVFLCVISNKRCVMRFTNTMIYLIKRKKNIFFLLLLFLKLQNFTQSAKIKPNLNQNRRMADCICMCMRKQKNH